MAPNSDDCYITPEDAATILGLSPLTLADWRTKGLGPKFCKFGRAVRYRVGTVRAWADGRVTASTSGSPSMEKAEGRP